MADVKWIKITTDMFDNRKIKHLRRLHDGNSIVLIWVMLLTLAGRCNSNGMIFLTENIPYTSKMLADELDFEESTVQLAIQALEKLGMIATGDDGFLAVTGWEEHQNIEGMEKIREQNRLRKQRQRENQKKTLIGDGTVCEYCGGNGTTVDHIIPKASGGLDVPENTVRCCSMCNMQKTNRSVDVFLNEKITTDSNFDISRILENKKIMQCLYFDGKYFRSRNVTGQVTESHATDIDIEEDKNKKKKKEIIYSSVPELNDAILSFIEFRKKIRKPMTDRAVELMINKLDKIADLPPEQIEILNQSIMNGWTGIFPLKKGAESNGRNTERASETTEYGTYL